MSLILRHRPDQFDIILDAHGWVSISELAEKSKGRLDERTIRSVVESSDKQRFALSADSRRVRANQGHSIEVDLELVASEPPAVLFHGTAQRSVEKIKMKGLISGSRQHVHLSLDRDAAISVGSRHGTPTVITVSSGEMHRDGAKFYLSKNGVWLTAEVAPRYLVFEDHV